MFSLLRFWTFITSKTKSRSIPPEVSLENQKASNSFDKAQLFNNFFSSVFIESPGIPEKLRDDLQPFTDQVISSLLCSKSEVEKLLIGLNVTKAHGPDGISARMLREAAPAISESMTNLFNFSLQSGTLPVEGKSANVIPYTISFLDLLNQIIYLVVISMAFVLATLVPLS